MRPGGQRERENGERSGKKGGEGEEEGRRKERRGIQVEGAGEIGPPVGEEERHP